MFFFLGRFFRVGRKKDINSLHEFYKLWKSDQALLCIVPSFCSVFILFMAMGGPSPLSFSPPNGLWWQFDLILGLQKEVSNVTVSRNWQRNTDGCRLNGFCFERPTSRVPKGKTNNLELTIGVGDESSNRCLSDVSESSPFSFCRFERRKNQNFEAETFGVLKTSRKSKRTHLSSTSERNLIQL